MLLSILMESEKKKEMVTSIIGIILVLLFFILASYLANKYKLEIRDFVSERENGGMIIYFLFTTVATIIAPISALPLLPIATGLWGPIIAALLSIAGWMFGAEIAFLLARKFGKPIIEKFISLRKLSELENKIPKNNVFWLIVLMRMTLPVDILSYAIGLFTQMKNIPYLLATLIGITPFAFIFAYIGTLPVSLQIIVLSIIIILISPFIFKKINPTFT